MWCVGFARQMSDQMVKRDCVCFNSMIEGYVKFGMVDLARELFNSMPMEERNSISWNTMISGCVQSLIGFLVALELFGKMSKKYVVSWNLIIGGFVKRGKKEDAYDMFRKMPVKDVVSWANMVYGYAKIGEVDVARSFIDEMPERDVIACNFMLTGYVQNGCCTEAWQLFQYMQSGLGLLPDGATLGRTASFGLKIGVALINKFAKCGSIENAMLVFGSIEYKDVDHWNAMIGGLAIHGPGEMAFELFMEMERLLVKPDDITFIRVLSAFQVTYVLLSRMYAGFGMWNDTKRLRTIMPHSTQSSGNLFLALTLPWEWLRSQALQAAEERHLNANVTNFYVLCS
ncbi:Pentatricopeptide repeat [Dillenia turbinata]|uniref:Pentatricopeptide repeat n=1 Tax=Dillenia turbinata TaxID=194707 RepID=A0AAN8URA4_9MAGN